MIEIQPADVEKTSPKFARCSSVELFPGAQPGVSARSSDETNSPSVLFNRRCLVIRPLRSALIEFQSPEDAKSSSHLEPSFLADFLTSFSIAFQRSGLAREPSSFLQWLLDPCKPLLASSRHSR